MKRWTIWHEIGFRCVVITHSIVVIVPAAVLLSPLLFVPGLWDGYTCWEYDDEC